MMAATTMPPAGPLTEGVRAINVGLAGFADPIRAAGAPVVALDWRPPAAGDRELGLLLAELEDDPRDRVGSAIAAANAKAVERILGAQPTLVDVRPAGEAIAGLAGRMLLHSGPPIAWAAMCGPVQGAAIGACLFEGWAATPDEARRLLDRGGVAFAPCHDHGAVGPMAGVVSPSMPVVVVENLAAGNRAFATLNEGLGKVLRFGAYDKSVIERLRWFASTLGPALATVLQRGGPIDLRAITAQALQMGDEGHNRNVAATSLLTRTHRPDGRARRCDRDVADCGAHVPARQRPLLPQPLDGRLQVRRWTRRTASPDRRS